MKVLITGAQGMLGQEFMREMRRRDHDPVTGWGRDDLDITNEQEITDKIGELRPNIILNCAAYNAVDKAEDEEKVANSINGEAVGYLAKVAAHVGATFVHFSSDYVFAGDSEEGYVENDLPNPISAYGRSKALGEQRLLDHAQSYKLSNWYLVRTSKLFGSPGTGKTSKKSFPEMMLGFAKEKGRIEAIDAERGSPTYVKDLTIAVMNMIEAGVSSGIYHIVNSGSCSWYEYAKATVDFAGVKAEVVPVPPERFPRKAKRPFNSTLLNTKLQPMRPWQEALMEFLAK